MLCLRRSLGLSWVGRRENRKAQAGPSGVESLFGLHLNPELRALVLEYDCNRIDDPNARTAFAGHDDLVLEILRACRIEEVLFGQTVVPAAIPRGQHIGVFLKRARELRTG